MSAAAALPGSDRAPAALPVRGARSGSLVAILPAVLMLYAALLPNEIRLVVAGQILYPPRLIGFALIPFLIARAVGGHYPKNRLVDFLMLSASVWMLASFVLYYGAADGFNRGTALMLDAALPYLAARYSFSSLQDFRRFLILVAPGLAVGGVSLLLDSVYGGPLVKGWSQAIFGALPKYVGGVAVGEQTFTPDVRLGLTRVSGLFPHPIIAGAVLVTSAAFFLSSGIRGWPRWAGLSGFFFGLLSISSAAALATVIAVAVFAYEQAQKRVTFLNWPLAFFGLLAFSMILQFGTGIGLVGAISRLSFNPDTAYFRTVIWEYGSASVWHHPLIGIGFSSYERASWMVTDSIDNQWLLLAVRHGIYPAVAMVGATIFLIVRMSRLASAARIPGDRGVYFDLALVLAIILVVGSTVAFFGTLVAWYYLLMGAAASLSTPNLGRSLAGSPRA